MQEVIVYRNPVEAAFWHSMSNGGALIFLMFGVMMFIYFIALYYIINKFSKGIKRNGDWTVSICVVLSAFLSGLTVWFLF
jgi:hypothetical protein